MCFDITQIKKFVKNGSGQIFLISFSPCVVAFVNCLAMGELAQYAMSCIQTLTFIASCPNYIGEQN